MDHDFFQLSTFSATYSSRARSINSSVPESVGMGVTTIPLFASFHDDKLVA
jgi:hypothetical protein